MTTPEPNQCPDAKQWRAFLDSQSDESASAELEAHLESCESCQQTLEQLAAGRETWEGTAEQLAEAQQQAEQLASSGHLKDVIEDLKHGVDAEVPVSPVTPESLTFLEPGEEDGVLGRLGPYDVLEIIGHGGMGVVLKAWEPSLRRVVAIKVLASHLANSAAAKRRFVREAQAAAAVTHDHVVAIHAVEADHEPPYLVIDYIEGKTLQQRIDVSGALEVREILRIGEQAALGLAAAHRQGIVYRDIKPANILLENGVERVRITDFGLAHAVDDASMTQSGVVAGTPLFMAPEQAQGHPVDHRSDLFSLGSVLYAMCSGRPPFRSSTMMGVIRRVCDDSPRPIREINPDVPDWLCAIVDRLLAKNPEQRFESADEVAELLAGCLAHVQRPLTVPLPGLAQNLGAAMTVPLSESRPAEDERIPTAGVQPAPATVSDEQPDVANIVPLLREAAERAVRWPARLMIVAAVVNAICIMSTFAVLLDYTPEGGSPEAGPLALVFPLLLLGEAIVVAGALQMRRLESLQLSILASGLCILIGPVYPLGWLAGIWGLLALGRDDVRAAFVVQAQGDNSEELVAIPTSAGRKIARAMAMFIAAWLAVAFPIMVWALVEPVDPDFRNVATIGVLAMAFGFVATFRYGYATRRHQADVQLRQLKSPGHWIGTMLSVFALGSIMLDVTSPFYQPWIQASVLPLAGVALLALLIIVVIRVTRRRRRRASQSDPTTVHPLGWPAGMAVPLVTATIFWFAWTDEQGYVQFDTNLQETMIRLHRAGTRDTGPSYGRVKLFRVPTGQYRWSITESGLPGDVIDSGQIGVRARQVTRVPAQVSHENFQRKLSGRWQCSGYEMKWSAGTVSSQPMVTVEKTADSEEPSTIPTWARQPEWIEIEKDVLAIHYSDAPRVLHFGITADTVNWLKRLFLVPDPYGDQVRHPKEVVQGVWAVGRNTLRLRLEPTSRDVTPYFHSRRTEPTQIEVWFKRPDDFIHMQGQWKLSSAEIDGDSAPEYDRSGVQMSIDGANVTIFSNMDRGDGGVPPRHLLLREARYNLQLWPDEQPRRFMMKHTNGTLFGLYRFSDGQLELCASEGGFPSSISTEGDGSGDIAAFRRVPLEPPVWADGEVGY